MPAVSYSITKLESNFMTMYLLALIFLRMLVKMTLPTLKMHRAAWLGRRVDTRGPERGESLPSKASMADHHFLQYWPHRHRLAGRLINLSRQMCGRCNVVASTRGGSTNKLTAPGFERASKKASTFNAAQFSLVGNNATGANMFGRNEF